MDKLVFVMNEMKMGKSMESPLTFERDKKSRDKEKDELDERKGN